MRFSSDSDTSLPADCSVMYLSMVISITMYPSCCPIILRLKLPSSEAASFRLSTNGSMYMTTCCQLDSESLNVVKTSFDSSSNERLADFCFFFLYEKTHTSATAHLRSFFISIGLGSKEVIKFGVAHIENE